MTDTQKATVAEFIGTFTLTFLGAGTGALAADTGAGLLGVAVAHGVALMLIIYTWGSFSGAHVNPAVTLGVLITGKIPLPKAIAYWIAQCIGAIVAAYVLAYLVGTGTGLGSTTGGFTPTPGNPGDPAKVIVVEAILTFFLMAAVFASGVLGKNGNIAGVAIGFVLIADILCGGALTGASMNPARTLGPAVAMQQLGYVWLYFVGPAIGAVAAALLYNGFSAPPADAAHPSSK